MNSIRLPDNFEGVVKAKLHKNLKQYTEINEYNVKILNDNQIIIYSRLIEKYELYRGYWTQSKSTGTFNLDSKLNNNLTEYYCISEIMTFDEKCLPTGKFKNILMPDQPHFEIIEYEWEEKKINQNSITADKNSKKISNTIDFLEDLMKEFTDSDDYIFKKIGYFIKYLEE